jgi:hypothetical protein
MANKFSFKSLLADDRLVPDLWLHKEAQEQPDETQFAQDFANLAFQFMQDRAPAMMKYLLGFEVVDRAENGTRAVGIFGFKIDGDYFYVPAFFLNSQVKGIDSILSKRTNSFVPLTEEWINYIINRKANELGKEAPKETTDGDGQAEFENPNFDFLRTPTVGPLGGYNSSYKIAEDKSPWTFAKAWEVMKSGTEEHMEKDSELREAFVGFCCAVKGVRSPMHKSASSPIQEFISKVGGPASERTFMRSLKNVKMANAALEFYTGPEAFHVSSYPNRGKDCYLLRKKAEEISEKAPKVEITDDSQSEEEARDVIEDGFTVRDRRDEAEKSDVVSTDYEKSFQNPDKPGAYDVLVTGGVTKRAYVFAADRMFHRGERGTMVVYFPDNKQVITARNRDIFTEGGCQEEMQDVYGKGKDIQDCALHGKYIFIGKNGVSLPEFYVSNLKRDKGERPVISGNFEYFSDPDWRPDFDDDFTNYWKGDEFHHRNGLTKIRPSEMSFCDVELASFTGSPKFTGSSVVMPSDWKALQVGEIERGWDEYEPMSSTEEALKNKDKVTYKLGSLDSLSFDLRKEGAARLDLRSDDGTTFYFNMDKAPSFTRPVGYKQAAISLVTKLGLRYPDAKKLLKTAAVERKAVCLVKFAQMSPLVGVSTGVPTEQTPGVDPYTGIPAYDLPFIDKTTMPFNGVELPPQDNPYGENLDGEISRQSESAGDGQGEAEFDEEAAGLAQDAAKLGQKHVFDKAAIGGLAKVYDTGAVIDSYIPEFLTAVDRLGRVLFLYYWKHNDFIERYGTDDVIEMEDVLRGTFKQLGKLTLDLKRKAVGGGDSDASIDTIGA